MLISGIALALFFVLLGVSIVTKTRGRIRYRDHRPDISQVGKSWVEKDLR